MFRLGKEQMAAFSDAAVRDFEDRMVAHLRERLPGGARSDAALREVIRDGIARAAGSGITSERGVCEYVEAMLSRDGGGDA